MGKAFDNLVQRYEEYKKEKQTIKIDNKVDRVRALVNMIQKECDFKTADDYARFINIGLKIIDEVRKC